MAKFDPKAFFSAHKKPLILSAALLAAAAAGLGIWYWAANNSSEPVYVYPFEFVGMTEYWGDSQESYGPVTSDNIQTIFLSETQSVTEILVKAGDSVKKGDLLMSFDTTLDDLKLERKRLDVEKKKLELEAAQNRLAEIKNMVPMQVPVYTPDDSYDENLGEVVQGFQVYGDLDTNPEHFQNALSYDGSSEVTPLILWLEDGRAFTDDIGTRLRHVAGQLQWQNIENAREEEETETEEEGDADGSGDAASANTDDSAHIGSVDVSSYFVVVRVTQGDQMYASTKNWTGLYIVGNGVQFFDPLVSDPYMEGYEADGGFSGLGGSMGSGYTAAQIAEMRQEQEKKIKDLEFTVKMVEAEYKLMAKEFSDGNIYAEVDGEVVSVLTEEEAKASRQPVVKVSGGGGFYVEGFVSELEKDKMTLGLPVTVNDWNTGMTYEAEVASVGDFPTQEGYWSGMGNPNASYYPFQVFVDGSADLQTGSFVSVMYSTSEGGNGVYLENPFLREEGGTSYVLVLGADGTLEKRTVITGKSLWGSYTEILSGVTPEDLIAFPYGKHIRPGVKAVEGDISNLYG